MRFAFVRKSFLACALLAASSVAVAAEFPVAEANLRVNYGNPAKQSARLRGRWTGTVPDDALLDGATLRLGGGYGEGGTATIALDGAGWKRLANGRGLRFSGRGTASPTIRSIVIRNGRNGAAGRIKIATGAGFAYDRRASHARLRVLLELDLHRWCAELIAPQDDGKRIAGKTEVGPATCPPELIVDARWLRARLGHPDVQTIDTRATPTSHVPGALPLTPYQLATTIDGISLQMMPPAAAEGVLSGIGLRRDATVVVYGTAPEYDPARLTWALYHLGHPDVRYLDGGWDGWLGAGGAVSPGAPVAGSATTYVASPTRPQVRVTSDYVLAQLGSPPYATPGIALVDARSSGEYVAGHIPSAVFGPWPNNLTSGVLKPRADLETLYSGLGLDPTRTTVTYCLVGWRASVAWLTLQWLGFADARVYDGSWLEWGASGFPVETGA